MKCFLLFFLTLSLLFFNVAALRLVVQSETIVGAQTLVLWAREASDPADLSFDLRFVQDVFTDVGLAKANIFPQEEAVYGTLSVVFQKPGKYVLKAVSGSSRNTQIGTSNEVQAVEVTSSTATSSTAAPSSTTSSGPTPTSAPSAPPSSTSGLAPASSLQKKVNLPAIVGGLIGSLIFLGLLAALIVYISRRKSHITRRFTFHKDMMVQRRKSEAGSLPAPATGRATIITPYPFSARDPEAQQTPPVIIIRPRSEDVDVERGFSSPVSALPSGVTPLGSAPLGTGHIVPSPRGPRPSIKRIERPNLTFAATTTPTSPSPDRGPPAPPVMQRTRRQQEITDRIAQLRAQMLELQSATHGDPTHMTVLDDMQRQMVWLTEQEHGAWAMGQTDIRPPGFARYMTP